MGCKAPSAGYCTMADSNAANDAQPVHRVYVDGFWMDKTDVTNEDFEKFVHATGYVTVAERKPTQEELPTVPPQDLVPGRLSSRRRSNQWHWMMFGNGGAMSLARTGVIRPVRTAT